MATESVDVTIYRPALFSVVVPRCGRSLGLELKHVATGSSLTVSRIQHSGAVRSSGAAVALGDRITAVNGRRGSATNLLAEPRCADCPERSISRCGWAAGLSPPHFQGAVEVQTALTADRCLDYTDLPLCFNQYRIHMHSQYWSVRRP